MNEFITIDFETGMYANNSAIAVGLVKFRDYIAVDTFYSLVCPPKMYIRPDFTKIHGLTIEDVKDSPNFSQIWESALRDFIGNSVLAAHNAHFDMGVLQATLEHYGTEPVSYSYFCTCRLSRKTWPQLKSHSLPSLANHFNIIYNAHNALDDAMTCGKLVKLAAGKFGTGNNVHDLLEAAKVKMYDF
jgi:DNA polymerase-3 subunit epsilon